MILKKLFRVIRKFGLEYCDLPTMLWNISVFLQVLTLDIYGKNRKGIPFYFYLITAVGFSCYIYAYLFSTLWFVFVRCRETGDLIAAMVVLSLGISSEIGTLKLLYMYLYIDNFRKLTDSCLEFDSYLMPGSRWAVNQLKYMRDVKKRLIFYWLVIMGSGTIYTITPFLKPGRHMTEDLLVIYGLEPMFDSPNYEITWLISGLSVFIICYVSANVTGYLIAIIGYTESQMLALSDEVTLMWDDAEAYYKASGFDMEDTPKNYKKKKIIMNEYVCQHLKAIIKRHATIKSFLNEVEDVCRGPIAVGFCLLIVGLLAEFLGGLENTFLQLPFAFVQVGVDCFIGQRVMDAGETLQKAVYNCKWEQFDKRNMKMILVMLQVSQRPTAISAGGVTKMSFSLLMVAMRAVYSAYTALRSTMNKLK